MRKSLQAVIIFLCSFSTVLLGSIVFSSNAEALNPPSHQFLADVNGDGNDDAVAFFPSTGQWSVALTTVPSFTGGTFGSPSNWINGHGVGSLKQFVADVTCDGKADAVVYFAQTGDWYVAPSTGAVFGNGDPHFFPYKWLGGSGIGSTNQMLADQHGTGCQSAFVTFSNGAWWEYDTPGAARWASAIAGSTASLQTTPNKRIDHGHGVGSTNQFAADVTGDGKADAVVYFAQNGCWYTAPYNSASGIFGNGDPNYTGDVYICSFGQGSTKQFMANIIGDSRSDAVVYFGDGNWGGAPATGSCKYLRGTSGDPYELGDSSKNCLYYGYPFPLDGRLGLGSDNQLLGDPINDGSNIAYPFVFFNSTGSWFDRASNKWIGGHGAIL